MSLLSYMNKMQVAPLFSYSLCGSDIKRPGCRVVAAKHGRFVSQGDIIFPTYSWGGSTRCRLIHVDEATLDWVPPGRTSTASSMTLDVRCSLSLSLALRERKDWFHAGPRWRGHGCCEQNDRTAVWSAVQRTNAGSSQRSQSLILCIASGEASSVGTVEGPMADIEGACLERMTLKEG